MNYYYLIDGQTYGPITVEDLKALHRSGDVSNDTQVCTEGADSWQPLSEAIQTEPAQLTTTIPPPAPPALDFIQSRTSDRSSSVEPPKIKTWTYSVVPFVAVIGNTQGAAVASTQLETMIQYHAQKGWEYVRLESVETHVKGDSGCFGIGATSPHTTVYSMAVFRK